MRRWFLAFAFLALLGCVVSPLPAQSFGFRGDGTGKVPAATPATQWSQNPARNIAWSTDVGTSYSGAVIAGDRLFVASEPNKLLCLDRATGRILWQKQTDTPDLPADQQNVDLATRTSCGFTTPSPICDGKFVYQLLGNGLCTCFDMQGNRKWTIFLDRMLQSEYGRSASPILVEGKLILPVTDFTAVDPANGQVLWENKDAESGYGTPIVVQVDNRPVIVTPKGDVLRPSDGAKLASDLGNCSYSSPVADGTFVFFGSNSTNAVKLAWKPDNKIDARKLWDGDLDGDVFASPVIANGLIFVINASAGLTIFDEQTGAKLKFGDADLKQLELPPGGAGEGSGPTVFNSPVLAGNLLIFFNNAGNAFLLEPTKDLKEISRNDLADGCNASPAVAADQLFMRSGSDLLCIQPKK